RPDLALLARRPTPPPRTRPLMGYFENIPQGKDPMGYLPGGPDLVLLGRPPTPPPRTRPPMGYVENIPTRKDSIGYCAGRPNLALLAQPPSPSPRTRRPMGEQISHPPKNWFTLWGTVQDVPTSLCSHDRQRCRRGLDRRWDVQQISPPPKKKNGLYSFNLGPNHFN
ncbi:hypothetical protein DFH07DRAFT_816645, partial [Mycena maculata]